MRTRADRNRLHLFQAILPWALVLLAGVAVAEEDVARFSDEPAPLRTEDFPDRPAPIVEVGDSFLGTGNLSKPFRLPTGAYWHPSFLAFGTLRTAGQSFDNGPGSRSTEWANY